MAYGGVNTGGVSGRELQAVADAVDQLAHDLITGEVTAALACRDGTPLLTRDGEQLLARKAIADNRLEAERDRRLRALIDALGDQLSARMERQAAELSARIRAAHEHADERTDALARDIMTGTVTQPLATSDGQTLVAHDGKTIMARFSTR